MQIAQVFCCMCKCTVPMFSITVQSGMYKQTQSACCITDVHWQTNKCHSVMLSFPDCFKCQTWLYLDYGEQMSTSKHWKAIWHHFKGLSSVWGCKTTNIYMDELRKKINFLRKELCPPGIQSWNSCPLPNPYVGSQRVMYKTRAINCIAPTCDKVRHREPKYLCLALGPASSCL